MRTTRRARPAIAAFAALTLTASLGASPGEARAQESTQGALVGRLPSAAPGAGWLVMDDLAFPRALGGALALSGAYAYRPMVAEAPGARVEVVRHAAYGEVAAAVHYGGWRAHLSFANPLYVRGAGGVVGGYRYVAPDADPETHPDTLSDVRFGFDARVVGDERSPLRVGLGAQLFVPSGSPEDYVTDGTYRLLARALFAGELGRVGVAGHLGAHVRLRDDPWPGAPRGSELVFGLAAGPRLALGGGARAGGADLALGPEVFGASSFAALFGARTTSIEALFGARLELGGDRGPALRLKVGVGVGLKSELGAPDARGVISIETAGAASARAQSPQ